MLPTCTGGKGSKDLSSVPLWLPCSSALRGQGKDREKMGARWLIERLVIQGWSLWDGGK